MCSVINKAGKDKLPIDLQFDLFDKMVMPVILYGCESGDIRTWGHWKICT